MTLYLVFLLPCSSSRQSKYISNLLEKTYMVGAKRLASTTISGTKLSAYDGALLFDPTEYRHVIGALQYCTIAHPYISYVINQLC